MANDQEPPKAGALPIKPRRGRQVTRSRQKLVDEAQRRVPRPRLGGLSRLAEDRGAFTVTGGVADGRVLADRVVGPWLVSDPKMLGAASASVQATGLARVLSNALLFVREGSPVQSAVVSVRRDRVCATGTDGYTAGTDHTDVFASQRVPDEGITVLVSRSALAKLCSSAAAAAGAVRLIVSESATLTLQSGNEEELATVAWTTDSQALRLYAAVADLIETAEGDGEPGCVAHVDTAMMARFREVLADKPNRRAEVRATGGHRPVLVTIGPTFRGLIMPVSRQRSTEVH